MVVTEPVCIGVAACFLPNFIGSHPVPVIGKVCLSESIKKYET